MEENGIDPGTVFRVSQTPRKVPARPERDELDHFHLDFGYAFATADGDVGRQESEVRGAGWYPLAVAERRGGIELVSQGSGISWL